MQYILSNNITHWKNVNPSLANPANCFVNYEDIVSLPYFASWAIGFTMAEGSFGTKANGSAFYSIKQKSIENFPIIRAIEFLICSEIKKVINPDKADCYQLALSSKEDIQKTINFFSSTDHFPLMGYKASQYKTWLNNLKASKRYSSLNFPTLE